MKCIHENSIVHSARKSIQKVQFSQRLSKNCFVKQFRLKMKSTFFEKKISSLPHSVKKTLAFEENNVMSLKLHFSLLSQCRYTVAILS